MGFCSSKASTAERVAGTHVNIGCCARKADLDSEMISQSTLPNGKKSHHFLPKLTDQHIARNRESNYLNKVFFVLNYSNKNVTGERDLIFVHILEHNLFNQKLRRLFCYCFFHLWTTLPLHRSAGAEKKMS